MCRIVTLNRGAVVTDRCSMEHGIRTIRYDDLAELLDVWADDLADPGVDVELAGVLIALGVRNLASDLRSGRVRLR